MLPPSTSPPPFTSPPNLSSLRHPSSSSSRIVSPPPATTTTRVKITSSEIDSLPEHRIILGCGAAVVDFLATVASYPKPDDKIRSTSLKVQGGGNAGNALTCAARLGLNPRLISKVADDIQGRGVLEELESDGVDTSFFVVSKEGNSPFTYIIVDNETKTRTCIHTPGYPPMIPDELSRSSLLSALNGAGLVYIDGRLHETALVIAQETARKNVPILIDAEKKREGLDDLLLLASYAVCSSKFPLAWTEAPSIPSALVSMLLRLPKIKFVIVTLGEDGCVMLERSTEEAPASEEKNADSLWESLKQRKDDNIAIPTCYASPLTKIRANGIGTVNGRMFVGTAEKIPPPELVDTTGAGDAFIGAVLYAICANMPPEKMLPFASQVTARKNVPILIDAEKKREGLDDLLPLASYAVCSSNFPLAWTEAPSIPCALVSMLLRLPKIKFVIVTLGEDGCVMLERSTEEAPASEEKDADSLWESLKQRKDDSIAIPTCYASPLTKIRANGIGTVNGRMFVGTAEKIPPPELVDTTGAGDAFIGAVLYAICANMPPEKMLPFASLVAAAGCRALGARTGLPHRTDPRLAAFLH